ncbi:MAG TPA: Gfo/Idh/MocA family oxidoreductase [Baekduia sp.]|nr:Gfo/Idh/MocA family oxidoreductase [Baekduia sp.]
MTAPRFRGALIGLGMIGRHHARLLQASDRVDFAGAVDPTGDRFGAVRDPERVFATAPDLLAAGPVDFAIVAVPTEFHLAAVRELAAAGVSVLVEKPLAATSDEARELIAVCERYGVKGAVGHVERFNPALYELRRRAQEGQVGEIFLIATERIGPFPDRIRDVGVVKDLATHDLDLVQWLGGPVRSVAAQTQHRSGREHEDLVLIQGEVESGPSFSSVVDWLTPTKVRRTRILGEHGMLMADSLATELRFYENARVAIEWDATQQFKGVSEGDMTRYALAHREPLAAELDAFCDLLAGEESPIVSLEEGLRTVITAEAVLESAATRQVVTPAGLAR